MIIQTGLDQIRDLIAADFDKGQLGTDGTAVSLSDTALGSAISGTDISLVTSTFHNGIKISYDTLTGNGSGNSAREWTAVNGDGTPITLLRSVFPTIDIESNTIIEVDTQLIILQEF